MYNYASKINVKYIIIYEIEYCENNMLLYGEELLKVYLPIR